MTTHEVGPPSALRLSPSLSLSAFKPMSGIHNSPGGKTAPLLPTLVEEHSLAPPLHSLLSLGSPSSVKQAEMLDRLKQLMAWQERQKASLLKQQQEEIIQLHEQQLGWGEIDQEDSDEPLSSTEEGKSEGGAIRGDQPQESIEECPSQRNMPPAASDSPVMRGLNPSNGVRGESPDERPIQPGIGKNLASFEELVESSLNSNVVMESGKGKPSPKQRSFLRQGQGIARFGLRGGRLKLKPKPGRQQKLLSHPLSQGGGSPVRSASSPHLRSLVGGQQGGVAEGGGSAIEGKGELPPRISTPSLVRCSSEDSFIIRSDHRLELEQEELLEFEWLEEAANLSYSSQLSLFNDPPKHTASHQPSHQPLAIASHQPLATTASHQPLATTVSPPPAPAKGFLPSRDYSVS